MWITRRIIENNPTTQPSKLLSYIHAIEGWVKLCKQKWRQEDNLDTIFTMFYFYTNSYGQGAPAAGAAAACSFAAPVESTQKWLALAFRV